MENVEFRKATPLDAATIWTILSDAIARRKKDGSNQWQDGYPNQVVVDKDVDAGIGYVLVDKGLVIAYTAILVNDEPEYANLQGSWITNDDFVVYHRVAVATSHLGMGIGQYLMQCIEQFAVYQGIHSLKADTNHDNHAMLHNFEKLGYQYCGVVHFRGSPRRAFEKVLR